MHGHPLSLRLRYCSFLRCFIQVGVVDINPADIAKKGRLMPGNIFLVDFDSGNVIEDVDLKAKYASEYPYGEWLHDEMLRLDSFVKSAFKRDTLPPPINTSANSGLSGASSTGMIYTYEEGVASLANGTLDEILEPLTAFGFTREALELLLMPMTTGNEPLGSMGNDAALAHISKLAKQPYEYFKQLFAQVTNPAIDPLREAVVMSLKTMIGPEMDISELGTPRQAHRLSLESPLLTIPQMESLKKTTHRRVMSSFLPESCRPS